MNQTPGNYAILGARNLNKPNKKTINIINPIFVKCSELIRDDFWKKIFQKASLGKFPRNFSYKNNKLSYKYRNKVFTREISDDPYDALSTITTFMRQTGKILSDEDKKISLEIAEANTVSVTTIFNKKWTDLGNKLKKILIYDFVDKLSKEYGSTHENTVQLSRVINCGIELGYIDKDDINYCNGKIISIAGLCNDENKDFYIEYKHEPKIKKCSKSAAKKTKNIFLEAWENLLMSLNNLEYKKINITPSSIFSDTLMTDRSTMRTIGTIGT